MLTYPNEPTGYSPITERAFDAVSEAGWGVTGTVTIQSDTGAPASPPNTGQVLYPAGISGGSSPGKVWFPNSGNQDRVYISFWIKRSSNWQWHTSGVNKIGFVNIHGNPSVYFSDQGSVAPVQSQIRLQNIPPGARNLLPNVNDVPVTAGNWYRWEVILISNTGSNADGEAHWWVNGTKVGDYTDIEYGTSTDSKIWENFSFEPIWGGIDNTASADMTIQMDHYYASGRLGPATALPPLAPSGLGFLISALPPPFAPTNLQVSN